MIVNMNWQMRFLRAIIFVAFGIPGVIVFMVCLAVLMANICNHDISPGAPIWVNLAITLISSVALLLGIGKIKQWLYLLVFFSLPISLILPWGLVSLINAEDNPLAQSIAAFVPFLLMFIMPFVIYRWVRRYYSSRPTPPNPSP